MNYLVSWIRINKNLEHPANLHEAQIAGECKMHTIFFNILRGEANYIYGSNMWKDRSLASVIHSLRRQECFDIFGGEKKIIGSVMSNQLMGL